MEESSNEIFENPDDDNENDGTDDQHTWIAPDREMRPTLFSGGGEDPLAQLDLYCRSHSDANNNSSSCSTSSSSSKCNENPIGCPGTVIDVDELLSLAEFLFGQKALLAALAIVDSRRSLITKLVAPSGRFVYTIRSSSSSNSSSVTVAMGANIASNFSDGEHYLCLLSPWQSSRFFTPIRYCSCRSFLEKSTRKLAALSSLRNRGATPNSSNCFDDENCHDGQPVCKHLLALSLLPHLVAVSEGRSVSHRNSYNHYSYPVVKCITEKEFASLILDRIL